MWSGRFSQELNAEFEEWQRSFPFDRILVPYEVAASKAHAAALAKAGVLSSAELSLTLKALDQIAAEGIPADDDPAIEDVHHYVEKRLVEIAGEVGLKLHTGRSRNEQIATDLRLYVRAQIDAISLSLVELASEFVTQAEKAGDAAMPSYTHLQRAEPVLVAHWLLAYVEMIVRDLVAAGGLPQAAEPVSAGLGRGGGNDPAAGPCGHGEGAGVRCADREQHRRDQRSRFRD